MAENRVLFSLIKSKGRITSNQNRDIGQIKQVKKSMANKPDGITFQT
jgi:hypothetical protein